MQPRGWQLRWRTAGPPRFDGPADLGHVVEIAGNDGTVLPTGEIGNVAIRGPDPVMFLEYWRNPAATRAKFAGDLLLTGDVGRRRRLHLVRRPRR